jgi:adenylate cyclase
MKEIERKFLLSGDDWMYSVESVSGISISQGYLNKDKNRTVRIRTYDNDGFLTVKGLTTGCTRPEYEYRIPLKDALELLSICDGSIISKTRYHVIYHEFTWEIDVFHGDNFGLVVAEIELKSEDEEFDIPHWVGVEVSTDPKYFNSNLSITPYHKW